MRRPIALSLTNHAASPQAFVEHADRLKVNSKNFAWIVGIFAAVNCAQGAPAEVALPVARTGPTPVCPAGVEFVATHEFLRSFNDAKVPDSEALKIAENVAHGCAGAGKRFMRVTELLVRSRLGTAEAMRLGVEMAQRTDSDTDAFVAVFARAYPAEYLDLDLRSSLRLALSLSSEFKGDVVAVRKDFEKLVDFCVSEKGLDLPKPTCAELSARVARLGEAYAGGIAESYFKLYDFLKSDAGPRLPTAAALASCEEVVASGPGAAENFMQAFRYAMAEKGLNLSIQNALALGKKMSRQNIAPTLSPVDRQVASKTHR